MLSDSVSPWQRNDSAEMPESLQKLISRMHSTKKRKINAPNSLPVRRQNAAEKNKMTTKKLSKMFVEPECRDHLRQKRMKVGLRASVPSKKSAAENYAIGQAAVDPTLSQNDLQKIHQPTSPAKGSSSVDDGKKNGTGNANPPGESTNILKTFLDPTKTSSIFATPRKSGAFKYPSECSVEPDGDGGVQIKQSAALQQEHKNLVDLVPNDDHNDFTLKFTQTFGNWKESRSADWLPMMTQSETVSSSQTVSKVVENKFIACGSGHHLAETRSGAALITQQIPNPPPPPPLPAADLAIATRSSLKSGAGNNGPKKWVTFNDIVQSESPNCFVDELYADSPDADDSKRENNRFEAVGTESSGEKVPLPDEQKLRELIKLVKKINDSLVKARNDILKFGLLSTKKPDRL